MGITERTRINGPLCLLLMRLLTTKYQPEKQTRSWEATIRVQRKHLAKFLGQSPSLRRELPEFLEDAYDDARIAAADETSLDIDIFPEACEWSVAEVLP